MVQLLWVTIESRVKKQKKYNIWFLGWKEQSFFFRVSVVFSQLLYFISLNPVGLKIPCGCKKNQKKKNKSKQNKQNYQMCCDPVCVGKTCAYGDWPKELWVPHEH